jgi:hypothetical protein
MSPISVPLKFGLVAHVVTESDDRPPYVPPPVARGEHAETCGCKGCAIERSMKKARAAS